jgi:hypothetical protein
MTEEMDEEWRRRLTRSRSRFGSTKQLRYIAETHPMPAGQLQALKHIFCLLADHIESNVELGRGSKSHADLH